MSDFDTRRVGEIVVLEEKIMALQEQLTAAKKVADEWKPEISSITSSGEMRSRITLKFGGKVSAATMTVDWLAQQDTTSATTAAVEALIDSVVKDRLRTLIEPEIDKLIKNAKSLQTVGKW